MEKLLFARNQDKCKSLPDVPKELPFVNVKENGFHENNEKSVTIHLWQKIESGHQFEKKLQLSNRKCFYFYIAVQHAY